jgi:hypothetical protein
MLMASCPVQVERKTVSWGCSLEADHEGPHMANEDDRSIKERGEWLEDQEAAKAQVILAETQGPPQTTAERYTDGASDHPGTTALKLSEEMVVSLTLTRDSTMCEQCGEGQHYNCYQFHQLIAVVYHDQEDLEGWCSCFQKNWGRHGVEPMTLEESVEPTKKRPGDQDLPRPTGQEAVQTRIIEKARILLDRGDMNEEEFDFIQHSMQESIRVGMKRYGTPLQTFNGRNTLKDLEDELRDAFVYISSINQASLTSRSQVIGLCHDAVMVANQEGGSMDLNAVVEIVVNTIFGAVGTLSNLQGD